MTDTEIKQLLEDINDRLEEAMNRAESMLDNSYGNDGYGLNEIYSIIEGAMERIENIYNSIA